MPYLVLASGRQETSVQMILDDVMSRQPDPEEIALLHNIFKNCIGQHLIRGYGVYSGTNEKVTTHSKKMDYCEGEKRPLWFVYSGMGSQWAGMGKQLMRIPLFAKSIQKSHKILEPKGLDLIKIITTEDEAIFDNILHSFVGIAAIQIALTDILKAVGLVPDNIIGE
ncbi:fatty acid synthase-like [Ostrinia furnacalis]|uniref:fatty acid synthase-like n=1 Tax=Ostrinia furnacalis TaxID=93504 RepID=UPI00103E3451|nr:fatty acid synthase-like [Ostrinia furnacalis]